MKITVDLPDYDGNGLDVIWENESYYTLDVYESTVVFSANKQALISFEKQMLYICLLYTSEISTYSKNF